MDTKRPRKSKTESEASRQRREAAARRLKAAQDRAQRRKMGKPIQMDDTDLDAAAEVRSSDVKGAVAFWREAAPPEFEGLLEATTWEGNSGA